MKIEREKKTLHFAIGIAPIVPAFGNDDIVHVSVSEDDPREGPPCPSQVQRSRPRDLTVYEWEPCVLQQAASPLRCQRPCVPRYCVHVTPLFQPFINPNVKFQSTF